MFLLASSCRLLASIESGDRMIRQAKVRPIEDRAVTKPTKEKPLALTVDTRAKGNERLTGEVASEEDMLETRVDRREWAKIGDNYKNRKSLTTRAAKSKKTKT